MIRVLKILVIILLSSLAVHSQIFIKPNNSYGVIQNRQRPDSTSLIPTFSVAPSGTASLHSINQKMGAIYCDSTGHRFWFFLPSDSSWTKLGATQVNDSMFKVGRDTILIRGTGGGGGSTPSSLQDVLTKDPNLYKNDTVDQKVNLIYFMNGVWQSDSIVLVPTQSFMSTDSILGVGHSIAQSLGAGVSDSGFIGKTHLYFNRPWANWAQISAGITRVVWQHNSATGAGHHRATIVMGALNSIRGGWTNLKTYRKIMNANKTIFVNQFALVQDSASGSSGITRSGSGWSTYAGQADAAKFNTTSFTNVQNDSITYNFSGRGIAVVMMGTDSSASNYIGSQIQIKIDGVSKGTFATNNQTDGVADGISGFPSHRSPMSFIFYGLKDSTHKITVINTENHYMYVDYFSTFVKPTDAFPLLIMHEPYMGAQGYNGVGNSTLIDAFNRGTDSMVATLPHYFSVSVGKTNTVYNGTDTTGDGIHPNTVGNRKVFLYGVLPAIEHMSAGKFFYTNNDLYLNDGTQRRKLYDTLNLLDASATGRGLMGISAQTFSGVKTFSSDIIVNSIKIGTGGGNFPSNTFVGQNTPANVQGNNGNTAFGDGALAGVTASGFFNTAIGRTALANTSGGFENTALGHAAGNLNTGNGNLFLGYSAGSANTSASNKLYIANNSTSTLVWGDFANNRVVIGSPGTPTDNGVGALQVRGKLTVDSHSIGSTTDSAVTWNRSTNAYEISKVNDPKVLRGTLTWTPGSVGSLSSTTTTLTVTGASVGDPVVISTSDGAGLSNGELYNAEVTSSNTVTVRLNNVSGGTSVFSTPRTYNVMVLKY